MTTIRAATEADLPALIAMGRAMHDESPNFRSNGFSEAKLERLFRTLQAPGSGCVFLALKDDEPVGMYIGRATEFFATTGPTLVDLAAYVKPEHRGGSAFVKLVRAFERWGADHDITDIRVGVSTGIHAEQTVDMYRRLGYESTGWAVSRSTSSLGDTSGNRS